MSNSNINWKKNLILIWICQFISISSFGFGIPFAAYYMQQDLGVTSKVSVDMYVALFSAATPLALAIFSPIWGVIADKFGRRPMLIRAYCGAAIVLAAMGLVKTAPELIALRFIQGILTGTVTASQTLVSVHTPENKSGLALGSLSAAVFSGFMAGSFFGGIFSDIYGYRMAFFVASLMMLIAAMIAIFGVKEKFIKPEKITKRKFNFKETQLIAAAPILILVLFMAFTRQFDRAFLPLLVQDIHGEVDGAAFWTGSLSAVVCVAGIISGILMGSLADKISPGKIGVWSALGGACMMIPMGLAHTFPVLFISRFMLMFFAGGLDPVFQIWLSKSTPKKSRALVFGWAATAKSTGWFIAPLCSGVVSVLLGLRTIYFIGAGIYLILTFMIYFIVKKYISKKRPI
jgi:DHA1 family multidrug resistance protein-like MFS transporter